MPKETFMVIEEVGHRTEALIGTLLSVWESSVRTTHDFLSEQDIIMLRPDVLTALRHVPVLLVALEEENPVAFLGMDGKSVEMLFVDAAFRGFGTGSLLMHAAMSRGACRVDVNEQNPQALGFYLHMGFVVSGRSPKDAQGRPFPILHLRLA